MDGNHMVTEKGPFEKYEVLKCPECESTQYVDVRFCTECENVSETIRCHACGCKTIPALLCHECGEIFQEEI